MGNGVAGVPNIFETEGAISAIGTWHQTKFIYVIFIDWQKAPEKGIFMPLHNDTFEYQEIIFNDKKGPKFSQMHSVRLGGDYPPIRSAWPNKSHFCFWTLPLPNNKGMSPKNTIRKILSFHKYYLFFHKYIMFRITAFANGNLRWQQLPKLQRSRAIWGDFSPGCTAFIFPRIAFALSLKDRSDLLSQDFTRMRFSLLND